MHLDTLLRECQIWQYIKHSQQFGYIAFDLQETLNSATSWICQVPVLLIKLIYST